MRSLGIAVAKIVMLAGGATLGAFLARVCEDWVSSRTHTQSEYDKTRYSQGLGAVVLPPVAPPQAPFQAPNTEQEQHNEYK